MRETAAKRTEQRFRKFILNFEPLKVVRQFLGGYVRDQARSGVSRATAAP